MEGWKSEKLGNICTIKKGIQFNTTELESTGEFPCINGGILPSGYSSRWNTQANTITISEGGNSCGFVNFITTKFWSGGHCYTLNDLSKAIDNSFLFYAMKGRENLIMDLRVGSGLPNIQQKAIREVIFNYPINLIEQKKIAQILSETDKNITQLEILIEKHNRLKTGLMQDLLTKGIDEQGNIRSEATHEFKESPLGRIPTEWKISTLQSICKHDITYGIVQAGPNIENGVPYIRTGDMSGDCLSIDNLLRTSRKIAQSFYRSEVKTREIVFALRATIGKVLLVPPELEGANLTQGTARVSADEKIIKSGFLIWCIRMPYFEKQILENQKGTTFFEISLSQLRKMLVAFPESIDEQNKIEQILDNATSSSKNLKTDLSKLQSLKTGLMQDLLSGKVRVNDLLKENTVAST